MYKVLLADNEQVFVNGLEEVFQNLPGFQIAAILQDVDKLTEVCQRIKPDLVLTRTFFFYKNTAFRAVESLKKHCPQIKVVMMLDTDKFAHLEMSLDAGADACIPRSASPMDYVYALQKTMACEPVRFSIPGGNAWGPYKAVLNRGELDVVLQLCQNRPEQEIAEALNLDRLELKACIANLLAKTKHKNELGLIFEAIHKGYGTSWRAEVG